MNYWLKQSTAVTIKAGPFLDKTDGVTEETGLTIAQADIRLTKNGGNIAQSNNAAGAPHDELGYYDVTFDTTDTNTLGTLRLAVHDKTTHLPVWHDFMVVPANVWDSMFGSDKLQVDVNQWNNSNIATPDTAGYPKVTIKDGTGQGEIALSSGLVDILQSAADKVYGSSGAAIPEQGVGAPPATPIPQQALSYLYMHLRNQGISNSNTNKYQIFNNAGTVIAEGTLNDNAGIFTKGKLGAPA